MSQAYKRQVLRRFLRDVLSGETVGASDGRRYGVSWLANYANELRDGYGVEIVSVPKGKGLKHYYIIKNKIHSQKILAFFDNQAKA
ncbi:MAG: hypothetical protein PHN18_12605 [Sulfurospirillaceae bacterium]|nr:hypothetical protein [Sulfurospirillaceae bacterium]MDD2827704.1 hypothetical protein [Sulfurospirillaceae bacterium]